MSRNPFDASDSRAGHGELHLILLPPSTVKFKELSYTYPLKLVSSTPHTFPEVSSSENDPGAGLKRPSSVPLIFLLSYGGGLLPPDALSLNVTLDPMTRLTVTTQGSTKIFPSRSEMIHSESRSQDSSIACASQDLTAELRPHSALLLSPDPTQPFKNSNYTQSQVFNIHEGASLGLLDWVMSGRPARGEVWDAACWKGRNELWKVLEPSSSSSTGSKAPMQRRLLLRDTALLLDGTLGLGHTILKAEKVGVFGTLILQGPVFFEMGSFFTEEFEALPQIGGREWGDTDNSGRNASPKPNTLETPDQGSADQGQKKTDFFKWRKERQQLEKSKGILWTAARVRGLVLVKFAAREVTDAREWLGSMFTQEGTIPREFGPGGLMSVR